MPLQSSQLPLSPALSPRPSWCLTIISAYDVKRPWRWLAYVHTLMSGELSLKLNFYSAQYGSSISWAYSTFSNSSFGIVMNLRTLIKIFSITHMSQSQTIFLTCQNTLCARQVRQFVRVHPTAHRFLSLQSLVNAISRIRFENGKSPAVVRQFLIDQLRYNDNTANPVCDAK
jgi:hypothetical protein